MQRSKTKPAPAAPENPFVARIRDINPEAVRLDGLDDAIIGLARVAGGFDVLAYDEEKCFQVLMKRDGMSRDDAKDFFCFNIADAGFGEFGPVFIDSEV